MKNILRWITAFPLAVLFSSLISSVFPYFASLFLSEPTLFKIFGTYLQFFVQGALFVMITYYIVPNYKLKSAIIAFLLDVVLILISEFYLKKLNSEPMDLATMFLSILGGGLGLYNMKVTERADKLDQNN